MPSKKVEVTPDPQLEKRKRRRFSAAEKLRITGRHRELALQHPAVLDAAYAQHPTALEPGPPAGTATTRDHQSGSARHDRRQPARPRNRASRAARGDRNQPAGVAAANMNFFKPQSQKP